MNPRGSRTRQETEQVDDGGADGVQTASPHQLFAGPTVRVVQEARAVDADVTDLHLADVSISQQFVHRNKRRQEAQGVTHHAQQLGVVAGGRDHFKGIYSSRSLLTHHIFTYTCGDR